MLTRNKIKLIKSLDKKKYRNETGCFLAEGNKLVNDMLPAFECRLLIAKPSWLATRGDIKAEELIVTAGDEIERCSLLQHPQDVIAVFNQPAYTLNDDVITDNLTLVLDGIQDPGNMGTIIRIADWFGIRNIVCTPDTADCYNPKTVQATMGALARVRVFYRQLPEWLVACNVPVYGTFLDGQNIYTEPLSPNGIIVMGNEGQGISGELEELVSRRLFIPNYPPGRESAESLNVAVATAVVCAEFRRRQIGTV